MCVLYVYVLSRTGAVENGAEENGTLDCLNVCNKSSRIMVAADELKPRSSLRSEALTIIECYAHGAAEDRSSARAETHTMTGQHRR